MNPWKAQLNVGSVNARSGILADARKREHYEKPSVKRKRRLKLQGNASINCILLYRFFKMNQLCCRSF